MESFFTLAKGRAGLKLAAVLTLCFASLGLFNADGRYVLAKQGILPNLDFAEGVRHWAGSRAGVSIRTSRPPVLLLSNDARRQAFVSQILDAPTAYRYIRVGADIKIDNIVAGEQWWEQAGIVLQSIDENGAKMRFWPSTVALLSGSAPWQRHEAIFPVAENATRLHFSIFLIGVPGDMAVRDIAVDALDPAPWFTIARVMLIALWAAAGLWIIVPLLRPKRHRVPAYGALFVFLATLGGVLTPQPELSQFLGAAQSVFDRVAAPPDRAAPIREKEAAESRMEKDAAPDRRDEAGVASPSTRIIAALPSAVKRGGGSFAAHFSVHAALAFLVLLAFGEVGWARLTAYLIVTAGATEIIQIFVVTRSVNIVDGAYNLAGIGVGVAAYLLWRIAVQRSFVAP